MRIALLIVLLTLAFLLLASSAFAQASPHNVQGRVLNDNHLGTGVPNGIPVWLNDTVSEAFVTTAVSAPPLPQFAGSYSATISGNDGDLAIVTAFNTTHFGQSNTTLLSTTTTIDVHLNRTRGSEPNVTILRPANNTYVNTTSAFNVTANISLAIADGIECNATISFSAPVMNITTDQNLTNVLGNIPRGGHYLSTWNVSGLSQGISNVTVSARCASDLLYLTRASSAFIFLTVNDTTPPVVNLSFPLNASWVTRNITFLYNVTENTGLANCSLYLDGRHNQTTYAIPPSTLLNFTLNETPEGGHSWFVSCFDNGSMRLQGNSSPRVFYADGTPPNVTLLFPLNSSAMESYVLFFRYNVSDNFNATNCSLALNTARVQTNDTIFLNNSNNFTRTMEGGDYNWSVNCTDNAGNTAESAFFSILSADLNISLLATTFFPVAKQSIWVNATVRNMGSANHTANASVLFWEHDLFDGEMLLLANLSANVTAGHSATLNVSYVAHTGDFVIVAEVDPPLNGAIVEQREDNNKANLTLFVPSYHLFYGDVIADILLSTSSSTTVFNWLNATSTGGNLYAADSDGSISFGTLRPLGRNASYNITFDDFAELDIALNTTNLSTSINRSYTLSGEVVSTLNFTLFEQFITDVPVVNSTNSSHFPTGILWDYSDSVDGNYTGTEDVVFVTKINRRKPGQYGDYDYELKLPARLESYVSPDLQNSVSFYREIT